MSVNLSRLMEMLDRASPPTPWVFRAETPITVQIGPTRYEIDCITNGGSGDSEMVIHCFYGPPAPVDAERALREIREIVDRLPSKRETLNGP